jgi:hypothetical protein
VARSGVLSARGIEAPDVYQAILEFRSGMIATTENNWIVPDTNPSVNDFKINVLGSKGMLSLDLTHSQLIEKYLAKSAVRPDVLVAPCIHGKRPGTGQAATCYSRGRSPGFEGDSGHVPVCGKERTRRRPILRRGKLVHESLSGEKRWC